MNEQLKKVWDPIKNFWGKLTKKSKIVIFICLGAAVLLAVVLSLVMNRTQYTVLYSGLGSDEAQEVSTELKDLDVAFKNENGTIYVDKNKENSVRMQLANEGYPKSVPNYNFFTDHVGVMTTDEERKIIEQYQLQERLGAVIKTLDPVDTAYVTISIPSGSSYAWDENKQTPTASVAVKLKAGRSLAPQQVKGIKQLVSKSVPSLKADDVSIVDSASGEEFSASSAASSSGQSTGSTQITLSEFKLKIEQQYEDSVQGKILNLLSATYGKNNISVSVKSKMDLDKRIQDIITYTPSTSDGKGMVSQSTETHEVTQPASGSSGGVAGTQSNSDTTTYPGVTVSGNVITTKDSKTYNYLVNQVEEQIQSDAAALDDLSVAVMINTDAMTNARQQELSNLVAKAAAVDPSKVAVMAVAPLSSAVNSQATQASANLPQLLANNPVILIAGGAFLLLLILLFALLAAKRNRERREQLLANLQPENEAQPQFTPLSAPENPEEEEEEEEEPEEEEPEDEDEEENEDEDEEEENPEEEGEEEDSMPNESIEELRNANKGKEQRVKGELQDFSSRNPEIAAQLIRSWLRGDDRKHG
ncbi:MAG: flagellar M-ring protein FliF [Oscillospiraceae bacterium]|jgi:flagellar M-ring protein FliF|nr:flagellar M-ring protein FliF [Oscillospiraceae bacterium]MCI1990359.1 flagellar M-ring protein FliF [Oscillospiraceae bacterium]MCI2034464.1 flagellar M-ring protein FliF [Oscillospiraceae bacterium]